MPAVVRSAPAHAGAASQVGIGRDPLFRAVLVLGLVNTGWPLAADSALRNGLWPSLFGLFEISAFAWAALPAVWFLLRESGDTLASRSDMVMAALVCFACLLPVHYSAAVATSALAIWVLATARPRTPLFRASLTALSALGTLFWGRLLLAAMGQTLLELDVALVRAVTGLAGHANILEFVTNDPAFAGKTGHRDAVLVAALGFAGAARLGAGDPGVRPAGEPPHRRARAARRGGDDRGQFARLVAMAHWPSWFDWLHAGPGAILAAWLCMALVLAANMGGNWRAITRGG